MSHCAVNSGSGPLEDEVDGVIVDLDGLSVPPQDHVLEIRALRVNALGRENDVIGGEVLHRCGTSTPLRR